jgi:hypothetical protein
MVLTLEGGDMNPREALPYLRGASRLRVSPKMKAEADTIETDQAPPARC